MNITKKQTVIYKGISILLIVLHNYLHLLSPKLGENEMHFKEGRALQYFEYGLSNPLEVFKLLFSYFGHYGVAVFIFLSAYGLTASLEKNDTNKTTENYVSFLIHRFSKIYIPFVLVILVYLMLGFSKSYLQNTPALLWCSPVDVTLTSVVLKLLLISNFIPGESLKPVGPWWFLSFIFQFYLIFPFIYSFFRKFGCMFLVFVSVLGYFMELVIWERFFSLNINFTIFGHLPLICFGLYLKSNLLQNGLVVLCFICFILGNMYYPFWILSDLSFTVLFLFIFKSFGLNNSNFFLIFSILGRYTLYIFLRYILQFTITCFI